MNPFLAFFPWLNFSPSSRDVDVDVGPGTRLSPHYHFSGDPRIEEEVVAQVASYGKQLGVLSDVVLALVDRKETDGEGNDERTRITELKNMVEEIEKIKQKYSSDLQEEIKTRLDQLEQKDRDACKRLLGERLDSMNTVTGPEGG